MAKVRAKQSRTAPAVGGAAPEALAELEAALGYRFRDRDLLAVALVHRSYLNEVRGAIESNERLEFLGDAAIGFVVARELYRRFPRVHEGQLTELRAHLVRWETLGAVGAKLGIGAHLLLSRGEERSGGRARPLILARAYEAVAGAILEDGGYQAVERFVMRTLRTEMRTLEADTNVSDVKSRLQNWAQARFGDAPTYHTIEVSGPDHARTYRVQARLGEQVLGEG